MSVYICIIMSVYTCTQIDTSEITSRIIRSTSSFQNSSKSHVRHAVQLYVINALVIL